MYDIFRTFVLFIFFTDLAVGQLSVCNFNVILDDNGGDGWNHNYLTGQVGTRDLDFENEDGETSKHATLQYGSTTTYTIYNVSHGDLLTFNYFPVGKYQDENLWSLEYENPDSPKLLQGVGSVSPIVQQYEAVCCCEPAKVQGLSAAFVSNSPYFATLTWEATEYAVSYMVYGQKNNQGNFNPLGEVNTNTFYLFVGPSITYDLKVQAISNFTRGQQSDTVTLTSNDYDTCTISVSIYDNFGNSPQDGDPEDAKPYLGLTINNYMAAYQSFDSKSTSFLVKVPKSGSYDIATDIIYDGDESDLEYVIKSGNTDLFHSGGGYVNVDNEFNVSCSNLQQGNHLLSYVQREEFNSIEQQAFDSPPMIKETLFQSRCNYVLMMNDTAGNGWQGGMSITISLNGASWWSGLAVQNGQSWYYQPYWVTPGMNVRLGFVRGTDPNPQQAYYSVATYENNVRGSTVASSGGNGQIPQSTSYVANCGATTTCPTNCGSLNRQACQTSFNPRTCGPCLSGFTASDGTTSSNSNSQCSAQASCPSTTTCNNANRNPCQTTFNPRTCGTCRSGFIASDGTTNSNSNSQCTAQQAACPSQATCSAANRNVCQNSFNPRTCGTCRSGFTASDGTTNSNSNSQCTASASCPTNPSCSQRNRNNCASGASVCGTCLSGYSASDGSSNSQSNTQCNDNNECTLNTDNCHAQATCTNTAGSFTCACNSGWTGNGVTCTQNPVNCGQRIRREWFSLAAQDRHQWIRAVLAMYNAGQYNQYTQRHSDYAQWAHGTAMFTPWHRPYLVWWEDGLRRVSDEFRCITQPYWDWTNSQNVQAIFTNAFDSSGRYRLGVGVKDGNCFSGSHPFAGFQYGGSCVFRDVMTTPRLSTSYAMANALSNRNYAVARPAIESRHNDLHSWVGGNMAQVPLSPSDPVFWVHHAFVDQVWAVHQTCHGGDTMVLTPTPSPVDLVWESSASTSFTTVMNGWSNFPTSGTSYSPLTVFHLVNRFNVKYEATWLNAAFANPMTTLDNNGVCEGNPRAWLAAWRTEEDIAAESSSVSNSSTKHLFGLVKKHKKVNSKYKPLRSHFRPSKTYLAQQQAIHETYKDTYLATHNGTLALYKAAVKSCMFLPQITYQQAQLFTPEMIQMMNFEDECRQGWCMDWCYQLTQTFN